MSLHWLDAVDAMIANYFFRVSRQDVTVTLEAPRAMPALYSLERLPGVLAAEPFRGVPVKLRARQIEHRGSVQGLVPSPRLNRVLDRAGRPVTIPTSGLLLSTTTASLLGVMPGDRIVMEVLEGHRARREVTVAALFETDLGTPIYMDLAALNRVLREGPSISGAYLQTDAALAPALNRTLKDLPLVAGVASRASLLQSFSDTIERTLSVVVFFYILFGGLLAFGVVYNSARIGLSERGRELASLRVLGFTRFEVAYILLGELLVLTLAALPVGCVIGYGLSWAITLSLDNELYRIPMVIDHSTYGIGVAVTLAATLLTAVVVRRRLDRLDLIAVLKTRE
jgi:putative ABC transport system permease protein